MSTVLVVEGGVSLNPHFIIKRMCMFKKYFSFFLLFSFTAQALNSAPLSLTPEPPKEIFQKLGQNINLNLSFVDQEGRRTSLQGLLKNKQVLVLTLNYFRCTTMCTYQFLNLAQVLKENHFSVNSGYSVVSLSFDPADTVAKAKQTYDIWNSKAGSSAVPWSFLVEDASNAAALAKQLNFYYEKDDEGNYSHAGALFFITPDGKFVRYLYGIVYDKSDFEFALIESSDGKLGTWTGKFLKLFKKYDPVRGRYVSIF